MKVFVIVGRSGSGKTSVASIIKEYYEEMNRKAVITGFSDYLKLYAHIMLGYNFSEETKPRDFLQKMGSYIRSDLKMPDMLGERLLMDIDIYKHFYDTVIISDARLKEEVNFLRENIADIVVIKVTGRMNQKLTIEQMSHETEMNVDLVTNVDYNLTNDSDYNGLKAKVYEILKGEVN